MTEEDRINNSPTEEEKLQAINLARQELDKAEQDIQGMTLSEACLHLGGHNFDDEFDMLFDFNTDHALSTVFEKDGRLVVSQNFELYMSLTAMEVYEYGVSRTPKEEKHGNV